MSTQASIGRVERLAVTSVWPDEARDFTPWLAENIDVIEEACGLRLSVIATERRADFFWVDILAADSDNQTVVIENQTGPSNHTHLGQVLTYLAAFDARIAIWITPVPRPEHVKAISWLNESRLGDFYLLKLEAVRIGDSMPAPVLTLIVGPSEEARVVGETKDRIENERHETRRRFWEGLMERSKKHGLWVVGRSPNHSYISTGAGFPGLSWGFRCNLDDAGVFLYIDSDTHESALELYHRIEGKRPQIEASFGRQLVWDPKEASRACEVLVSPGVGSFSSPEENWPQIHDALIDYMQRFMTALKPVIDSLRA